MLTIFLILFGLKPATAERPLPPRTGLLEISGAYSYFTTSANYDLNGTKSNLRNSGGLSTNAGAVSAAFDFNGRFRAYGGLVYADTSTTDGFFDRQNGTVTEIPFGAQFFGGFGKFLWVVQGDAGITIYKVSEVSDTAVIAEGVNRGRGGGWLIYRAGQFQPFVNLAGEYRDGGRSSLIPYAVGGHIRIERFWAQLEARGAFAIGNDSDSNLADRARREAYLNRVNGGSFRYYAVNPTTHEFALEVGLRLDQFNIFAGAAMTYLGTSTAQGTSAVLGVRFTMPTARKTVSASAYAGPTDDVGFAPKEESYDDTLFHEEPKAPPPSRRTTPAPTVKLIPRRKGSPINRKQQRQQKNLNQLLNETERGLEER